MNRLLTFGFIFLVPALFSSCATNREITVGGVPGWLANGAVLEYEPDPVVPDPAIIPLEMESGPVAFTMNTEKRRFAAPPAKKKTVSSTTRDPLERGRDARIKRLFR